jgi:hypothetical protein
VPFLDRERSTVSKYLPGLDDFLAPLTFPWVVEPCDVAHAVVLARISGLSKVRVTGQETACVFQVYSSGCWVPTTR